MIRPLMIAVFILIVAASAAAVPVDTTIHKNSNGKRVYITTELKESPPAIDGHLDDACWRQGVWSGNYRQNMPDEGADPIAPTELKILYDQDHIYAAFRVHDDPEKIERQLARRDDFSGDIVGLAFDCFLDYRAGYEFNLTAAGGKIDLILMNRSIDLTWDPVWEGKVATTDWGWTAEMAIPLSQLRYNQKDEQVWGLHSWRWINRNWEEDQWALIPRDTPGRLYDIGELHGLKMLPARRRIELLPYTVGKLHQHPREAGNPFATGSSTRAAFGLDGKIGVSSDFTMDFTINPDFGQVEADPSVLNLSNFETFYDEKRPFFLEGKNILDFDFGHNQLFYSRRIGHRPSYSPDLDDNEYADIPQNTSILGAVKLTGKTPNGLSVGVLESVTARETAKLARGPDRSNVPVEPLTNFFVSRVQKNYNQNNTQLGAILTATHRSIRDKELNFLNKEAYTGGIDFRHHWQDKTYFVDFTGVFSHIAGAEQAILDVQTASARYFQRPDADHLDIDSTATLLNGYGVEWAVGKSGRGNWRWEVESSLRSPGLELNDLGFMHTTDHLDIGGMIGYEVNKPTTCFREYSIYLSGENVWNTGGAYLGASGSLRLRATTQNKWHLFYRMSRIGDEMDTRVLRGGAAMFREGHWCNFAQISTDRSSTLYGGFGVHYHIHDDRPRAQNLGLYPWMHYKMTSNLELHTEIDYNVNRDPFHYIDTFDVDGQDRYVTARLDRRTLGMTLRLDLAITPELTIQYYGNPYISLGRHSHFKEMQRPSARDPRQRYTQLDDDPTESDRHFDVRQDGAVAYGFDNPDFNYREFRSNLVARWEFRPGSTLYLVWTHGQSAWREVTGNSLGANINRLFDEQPDDIFLMKFNYWFSI